ncbi:MAG: DNA helicase RecQ [Rhodospirillaceae bacterium]|nr:DNA helicase RecQ [Rhodospirillaceae bacterium]MDD9927162.1 DNA helicase RecQ [Rhodospirillaceae bacterium]
MTTDDRRILHDVFGFEDYREGQEPVVRALLAGRNALAVMPTGSGKSLCFQVSALALGGLTIVVSPLVALMQDQVASLRLAGVAAETINSARDRADNVAAWRRVAAGETRLLYLSPERLMTDRMLAALAKLPIRLIAIDEAHCISQWGPAFRPDYEALADLRHHFPGVPIAALTATADNATRRDIAAKLFEDDGEIFVAGFDRPNIKLAVEMRRNGSQQLLAFLQRHRGESGIVYCLSRKKTENISRLLSDNGIAALPYHAGMDKWDRDRNQDIFMTEPGQVMVATIAFGMGIDKPDVRFVFHTDLPGSMEAYYQEIGRAGRDGQPAEAHMLYGLDDIRMRRVFIEQEDGGDDRRRREHQRLDALIGYCEAATCRRTTLLAYFGDTGEACGNCDTCLDPVELLDGSEVGQQALTAIVKTGQRFGAAHIIDVLRGTETEKVISARHDQLPPFGVGVDRSKDSWRSIIRQLVAAGFLKLDIEGYGGLSVTDKGQTLLEGDESFAYREDRAPAKPTRKSRSAAPLPELDDADDALLAALKNLRLRLAKERGVPAYVVFSDRSLIDMAQRRPRDAVSFAEVHGVGDAKLRDFGDIFLRAIAEAA